MGNSLGGAVAIQAAAGDDRVRGVIAAEAFSDLRTIAIERAPRILPRLVIDRAFQVAEERGDFDVASVSPVAAAASLNRNEPTELTEPTEPSICHNVPVVPGESPDIERELQVLEAELRR